MRVSAGDDHFRVRAIAGTYVVLMALDMDEATRKGLRGFAIKRGLKGQPQTWLRGIKYFKDLVAQPKPADDYSSRDEPFQTFLWSDYQAAPATQYDFTIVALYGDLHAFEERHTLTFSVTTEAGAIDAVAGQKHGVWFNRGAIASHAFATEFNNQTLTDAMANNVSDAGELLDPETKWLSRGLAEACLAYINGTKPGEALRVCAYEFAWQPVLLALKRALGRGVDVQIVYHDTKKDKDENRVAIATAGLPATVSRGGKTVTVLYPRTRTAIPHNKFIVKLVGDAPKQVWTGSTNFTISGFFGQTNVGHLVTDDTTAATYLKYWTELSADPPHSQALQNAIALTPNPKNVIAAAPIGEFFSPRIADNMLDWYGQRITDAASLVMMTIPFNVAATILTALDKTRDAMRLVILEDNPAPEVTAAEKRNQGKLAFSNGAILGKSFVKLNTSFGGARVTPIPNTDLDKWFIDEELDRPVNSGHVFFVHAKVLVIDPLSDDPLVCAGSANFSKNSLTANDENMLLVRGDTRTADIYMTEIDRIFRHFYARDAINKDASDGVHNDWLLLDPTDGWITPNYQNGNYKNNRRLLFFPLSAAKAWSVVAATDPDPFADEAQRAAQARSDRNTKAKARRAASPGTAKTAKKTAAKKKASPKKASKKAAASKKKPVKKSAAKAPKKVSKKKTSKNKTSKKKAVKKAPKKVKKAKKVSKKKAGKK